MLFLPMRCFMRFCYKLHSSSGVPSVLGFPELLDLVVDDSVALPLDRDMLSRPQVRRRRLGLSRLALHTWYLSSDFSAHAFSPGVWLNWRLGLGGLLRVRDINLVGILEVACLRKYEV